MTERDNGGVFFVMNHTKVRFSLRYKFLLLTSTLLVLSVLVHLSLATQVFKQDKTELVYDLNRSLVTNLRNEIENKIEANFGKMALITVGTRGGLIKTNYLESLIGSDLDLLMIVKENPDGLQLLFEQNSSISSAGITNQELQLTLSESAKKLKISEGDKQVWPIRLNSKTPLLGLSQLVLEEDSRGKKIAQYRVHCVMSLEGAAKSIQSTKNSFVSISNLEGEQLFSSNNETLSEGLKKKIESTNIDTSVLSLNENDKEILGAYSKGQNILVVAITDANKVFSVVRQLIKRSLLFGAIVICSSFLLILLFSKSITSPLDLLMSSMEKVASGDLNQKINLKTQDEISLLSNSFNQMIQDLKSSREQLEEINRDLEKKVLDRTKKLEEQNRAVKEAQEALLHTTRLASVGEIAGRAAHEVLNPLTGILTRLDKVQQRLENGIHSEVAVIKQIRESWINDFKQGGFEKLVSVWKTDSSIKPGQTLWDEDIDVLKEISEGMDKNVQSLVEDAKFLVSESQRINRIVSQMRSLSHVKRNLKLENIHQTLNESLKIMADLFDRDKVKLICDFSATDFYASINKDEFIQSITNLLRNSLQALHAATSEKLITIRTFNQNKNLLIELEDNGIGINIENQSKLFSSQFTTKDPSVGTGLGLSISRRFIRGFEGDLSLLKSEINKGSTFLITLPVVVQAENEETENDSGFEKTGS